MRTSRAHREERDMASPSRDLTHSESVDDVSVRSHQMDKPSQIQDADEPQQIDRTQIQRTEELPPIDPPQAEKEPQDNELSQRRRKLERDIQNLENRKRQLLKDLNEINEEQSDEEEVCSYII